LVAKNLHHAQISPLVSRRKKLEKPKPKPKPKYSLASSLKFSQTSLAQHTFSNNKKETFQEQQSTPACLLNKLITRITIDNHFHARIAKAPSFQKRSRNYGEESEDGGWNT
jgi:hypothetical protein